MPTPQSLDAIFRPRSVAVIGASTRPGAIGRVIFEKLLASDFNGPVFPVHPKAEFVRSVKTYPGIGAVPQQVDLAIIAVKREHVQAVVQECAEAGVRGLIVVTAGFREVGEEGRLREEKILSIVREHGMRMVGPNCMGVICTDPEVRLDGTFAPTIPLPGNIGFVSQSGALGVTILEYAASLNLGVSMFVSIGNKADIAGNDVLAYWQNDESVDVILMYLESFGRPQEFVKLAREISRQKPIIIVKSGRTSSGARAASSHTGALAGTDVLYDAMFRQCGIIRADSIEEMFDFAMGFANQPLPAGNRVAVITNAGGPAIMAADACENLGLELPALSEATQAKLRERVSPEASTTNPVDLLAGADETDFQFALQCVLADPGIDAAIVIFVPPLITDPLHVARSISSVTANAGKPVMGCFMGVKGIARGVEELKRHDIPAYAFPESAAKALHAMHAYQQWRSRPTGEPRKFHIDSEKISRIIAAAQAQERDFLSDDEAMHVLRACGIPSAETRIAHDEEEILREARGIGFPVVLKLSSRKVLHKTEHNAVKVGLRDEKELRQAIAELEQTVSHLGIGTGDYCFLIQEMVQGGREVMFGCTRQENFGPLLAFGLGGIYVEVFRDVSLRIAPILPQTAREMVESIRGYDILKGVRGETSVDMDILEETLLRLSQLVCEHGEITELDINPFLAFPERSRCKAVDARIGIALQK
ncbi:MAG TPA: CoA-binding protein [Bacteroidetes bacterium]|nr:CoA-binding protein [Bacteroidota bacterium]